MKVRVEIEVDERDLDAVAFALGLTPKDVRLQFRKIQGQVNAQNLIAERMRSCGIEIITNSRNILFMHEQITKETSRGPEAQQAVQP